MDKEQEINEMAKAICSHCLEMTEEKVCSYANAEDEAGNETCFAERLHEAEKIYNAGYGKVENYKKEIARLKEENERLKIQLEQANCGIVNCSGCAMVEQQAIKEFAKRIIGHTFEEDNWSWTLSKENVDDLLKEYGIGEE